MDSSFESTAMLPPSTPVQNVAQFEFASDGQGGVTVRLSGEWKMTTGIPGSGPLLTELTSGSTRKLRFQVETLQGWDSALLGFLLPLAREAEARSITFDSSGLPEGVRRLLELALHQPPRATGRVRALRELNFTGMARFSEGAAHEVIAELSFLGEVTLAMGRLIRGKSQLRRRDFLLQLQECGAEALPIVILIGFLVGAIIGFVGSTVLETYGAALYTANMVAIATARELGAMMTAVILSGRTGAAFAANLGTMRTNEEIDALQTVGLNPIDFLVVPRVLALCLMIPLLTAFADLAGIMGGMLVTSTMPNVTFAAYIHATLKSLTLTQILIGLGKSVVFGGIISLVGCRRGLECGRSAASVGLATTSAVVVSITLLIAVDGILAVVFNALKI